MVTTRVIPSSRALILDNADYSVSEKILPEPFSHPSVVLWMQGGGTWKSQVFSWTPPLFPAIPTLHSVTSSLTNPLSCIHIFRVPSLLPFPSSSSLPRCLFPSLQHDGNSFSKSQPGPTILWKFSSPIAVCARKEYWPQPSREPPKAERIILTSWFSPKTQSLFDHCPFPNPTHTDHKHNFGNLNFQLGMGPSTLESQWWACWCIHLFSRCLV